MAGSPAGADDRARLEAVRERVRELAHLDARVREAIRASFEGFRTLEERYRQGVGLLRLRERELARDLLAAGHLFDPACRDNRPCLWVDVRGLCAVGLAKRLSQRGPSDRMPVSLERDGARAALAALDRDMEYQAQDLPGRKAMHAKYVAKLNAGKHVEHTWHVVVARPGGWAEPADPASVKVEDLRQFSDADYRTIALHRLGGLADVGAVRPIVPEPVSSGHWMRDLPAGATWVARMPIAGSYYDSDDPPLSPGLFPPSVAEEMLAEVERWVREELPQVSREPDYLASQLEPAVLDSVAERAAAKAIAARDGGTPGSDRPTSPPAVASQRLVPVAAAAQAANMRSDALLRALRSRKYTIVGVRRGYMAELAQILVVVPKKKRQLTKWADETFPAA